MKHLACLLLSLLFILPASAEDNIKTPPEHRRGEEQTYLTFPEWWIVYSSDNYAKYIKDNPPSGFPYFGEIGQFWGSYGEVIALTTDDKYPFNTGYHVMILVIGTSLTVEYAVKAIYENTLGRLTEWTSSAPTEEDTYAAHIAADYVNFIRVDPWYLYDFGKALTGIWDKTGFSGPDKIRKIERKFALSFEYGFKAAYAWLIKLGTRASYDAPLPTTATLVSNAPATAIAGLKSLHDDAEGKLLLLPRYQPFTTRAQSIAKAGGNFVEIAGNRGDILLTAIASSEAKYGFRQGKLLFTQPILIDSSKQRFGIRVPVQELGDILRRLDSAGMTLEHIYDY
jgi:hypothetical protein